MSAPPAVARSPSPPPVSYALEGATCSERPNESPPGGERQHAPAVRGRSSVPSVTGWPASSAARRSSAISTPTLRSAPGHVRWSRRPSGGAGDRARCISPMVRALARDLGLEDAVEDVRVPRHQPGPPETLTDTDYANLLRVADRRRIAGKRDYALLRVLGDCGLRSAELRGLRARGQNTAGTPRASRITSATRRRRSPGSLARIRRAVLSIREWDRAAP
jgi:hypothetical protein